MTLAEAKEMCHDFAIIVSRLYEQKKEEARLNSTLKQNREQQLEDLSLWLDTLHVKYERESEI
jgi:hypothetical protein